ncbi:MAG: amidohydrolase [Enterobacterales bacterium]|nr:amidohydrolase [Enterobacterales bacterium]
MMQAVTRIILNALALLFVVSVLMPLPLVAKDKRLVDLIVEADYLITMQADEPPLEKTAVVIDNSKIIAIGETKSIHQKFHARQIISGKNRVLMPGLINTHTHTAMTLFRGMADDMELMPWLNQFIFPMEGKFVDPEFIKIGSKLACYEMIKGGITSFVDMYFYPDIIAQQTIDCGLRGMIGAPMIDYPSPGFSGWDDSFAAAKLFVKKWQGKHPRIIPAFAPHAPYTVSSVHIKQVADAARAMHAPVTIHIAETSSEEQMIQQQYHTSPVQLMQQQGLFDHNKVIAAHMVHPNPTDIQILAKQKVGVAHNPTSNLKLAAGIAPVPAMLNQGIAVGLGTDGAASNNDLDLWEEIRLAALIHKNQQKDPKLIPAYSALKMATKMGAKVIGLEKQVGQIKVGMQADLIQIDLGSLRLQPIYNLYSHLVYVTDSSDVSTTIVAGKVLMLDGKVLTIDVAQLKQQVAKKSKQIKQALLQQNLSHKKSLDKNTTDKK